MPSIPLLPGFNVDVSAAAEAEFYSKLLSKHLKESTLWAPASRWDHFGELFDRVSKTWFNDNPSEPTFLTLKGPLNNGWCAEVIWSHREGEIVIFSELGASGPLAGCKAIAKAERLIDEEEAK